MVVERSRNALCSLGICWVQTRLIASLHNSAALSASATLNERGFFIRLNSWSLSVAETPFARWVLAG